jgi:hypothetical protein
VVSFGYALLCKVSAVQHDERREGDGAGDGFSAVRQGRQQCLDARSSH